MYGFYMYPHTLAYTLYSSILVFMKSSTISLNGGFPTIKDFQNAHCTKKNERDFFHIHF